MHDHAKKVSTDHRAKCKNANIQNLNDLCTSYFLFWTGFGVVYRQTEAQSVSRGIRFLSLSSVVAIIEQRYRTIVERGRKLFCNTERKATINTHNSM